MNQVVEEFKNSGIRGIDEEKENKKMDPESSSG